MVEMFSLTGVSLILTPLSDVSGVDKIIETLIKYNGGTNDVFQTDGGGFIRGLLGKTELN